MPEDRAAWHPQCCTFYEYWLRITPPGRLPGRQHVSPLEIVPLLPRVWLLDVTRAPLRFRYRLVGTGEALTLGREVTGQWAVATVIGLLATSGLGLAIFLFKLAAAPAKLAEEARSHRTILQFREKR